MNLRKFFFLSLLILLDSPLYAQTFSGTSGGDIFVLPPYRMCVGADNGQNVCFKQTGNQLASVTGTLIANGSQFTAQPSDAICIAGIFEIYYNSNTSTFRQCINGTANTIGSGGGSVTVNSQTCTIGSSCTIPLQTNGVSNASQAGVNVITSTTNSCGTTLTPANPSGLQELVEATGTTNAGCGGTGVANPTAHGIYAAEGSSPFILICAPPNTNGQYTLTYNVTASATVDPTCPQNGLTGRAITGSTTTNTVVFGDNQQLIVHAQTATGALTETLPTPATLGNSSFVTGFVNASPQSDTLKATTNTIQLGSSAAVAGATGITVPSGAYVRISVDPSTANQWHVDCSGCAAAGTTSIGAIFTLLTGSGNTEAASTTTYIPPGFTSTNFTSNTCASAGSTCNYYIPAACTLKNLTVITSGAQPSTGTFVFTVFKNATSTSEVVTIAANAAAGNFQDTVDTVSLAALDKWEIQAVNNATTASATTIQISITCQ